jgi:hypothetical protein
MHSTHLFQALIKYALSLFLNFCLSALKVSEPKLTQKVNNLKNIWPTRNETIHNSQHIAIKNKAIIALQHVFPSIMNAPANIPSKDRNKKHIKEAS